MTESNNGNGDEAQVLKSDKIGRVRSTAQQREAMLSEFDRSGLCGTKFAALVGVNYQTFASWLVKRRRVRSLAAPGSQAPGNVASVRAGGESAPAFLWVEAQAGDPKSTGIGQSLTSALVVELPGGMHFELNGSAQVPLAAQLLKALALKESRPC
jgi:hypothetical protein